MAKAAMQVTKSTETSEKSKRRRRRKRRRKKFGTRMKWDSKTQANRKSNMKKIEEVLWEEHENLRVGQFADVKDVVKKFQDNLINTMKECDTLFEKMYKKYEIAGSVKLRLKIENPDEYDVNVHLELPVKDQNALKLQQDELLVFENARRCCFRRTDWQWPKGVKKSWKNLICSQSTDQCNHLNSVPSSNMDDDFRHLRVSGVKQWIQSVVHRAILKIDKSVKIRTSERGPAVTLKFSVENNKQISLDIVPVIRIPTSVTTVKNETDKLIVPVTHYLLVPCPPKVSKQDLPPTCLFQLRCPTDIEFKHQCMKPIIRLMKLIRNRNDFNEISSYSIYNLCWRVFEDLHLEKNRKQNELAELFIKVLIKLETCLKDNNLPMMRFKNVNLFVTLTPRVLSNRARFFQKINRRIEVAIRKDDDQDINEALKQLFRKNQNKVLFKK